MPLSDCRSFSTIAKIPWRPGLAGTRTGLNSLLTSCRAFDRPETLKIKGGGSRRRGRPAETLISLPPDEAITKQFRTRLRQLGVNWPIGVQVSSLDLIPIYVSLGFGVGLSVAAPGARLPSGLRILPLSKFPPLVIAALWQAISQAEHCFLKESRNEQRMSTSVSHRLLALVLQAVAAPDSMIALVTHVAPEQPWSAVVRSRS